MGDDYKIFGYLNRRASGPRFLCPDCAINLDNTLDSVCPVYGINLGFYSQTCYQCGTKVKDGPCDLFNNGEPPLIDDWTIRQAEERRLLYEQSEAEQEGNIDYDQ